MTEERELLRRISSHSESRIPTHFIKEIQQLLAQPEQTEQEDIRDVWQDGYEVGLRLAKREPLSDLDVFTLYEEAEYIGFLAYRKGIKDAEKAHGITGGEE